MTPTPSATRAIADFSARLHRHIGPRLRRLVLFGSYARGQATDESDIDVLVLVDDLTSADTREVDEAVAAVLTEMDILLSPLVLDTARFEELRARERRIAVEIERDGRPL